MRLARGRAGWALLTAGTVGLTVSGAVLVTSRPVPAKTAEAAPGVGAAQERLAEIKVELAWLTDPTTFPYELAVGAINGRLEVGGIVPNDAVRQRALLLTRLQSPLPVVDKLVLVPKFVVPVQDKNSNLGRTAEEALTKTFAHWKGNFQVSADAHGQITVTGEVPSCEDKLTISRRLAQLTGCTSVINELAVVRVVSSGKAYTVVSADGKVVLPGEPKEMMPSFVPAGTKAAAVPPKPTPPAVVVTPPKPAPPTVAVVPPPPKPTPPAPLPPAVVWAPAPVPAPAAPPTTNNTSIVLASATTPAVPNAVCTPSAPSPVPAQTAPPKSSTSIVLASATTTAVPNAVRAPSPPPAPPPVRLTSPLATTKPAAAQLTPEVVAKIRHRIEQTCGSKASDLALKVQHSNQLELHFTVHKESEGQQLGLQVMNLPELAPFKVDLRVDVK